MASPPTTSPMNRPSPTQQHQNSRSARPNTLPRSSSYSKRHASFHSPREVPLPSPSLRQTESVGFFSSSATANLPSPGRSSKAQDVDPSSFFPQLSPSCSSHHSHSYFRPIDEDTDARQPSGSKALTSSHTPPASPQGVTPNDYLSWRQMQEQMHHMSSLPPSPSTTATPASCNPTKAATSESQARGLPPAPTRSSENHTSPASQAQKEHPSGPGPTAPGFAPVYSSTRPFSVPDAHSHSYHGALAASLAPSDPALLHSTTWGDRSSSESLPLPNQIPFHILQRSALSSTSASTGSSSDDMRHAGLQRVQSVSSSSAEQATSGGSGPGPGTSSSGSAQPAFRPAPRRPVFQGSSSSGSDSSSSSSYVASRSNSSSDSSEGSNNGAKSPPTPLSSTSADSAIGGLSQYLPSSSSSTVSTTVEGILANTNHPARPISPFRAPQPSRPASPFSVPPQQPQRPISPFRAPQPQLLNRSPSAPQPTAMRRFVSPSPVYPPPEPPTILPNDSTSDISSGSSSGRSSVPFLSTAPPPPDSWLEVETTQSEYRLHVRLPGFSREGITLATKRRRILHVVADSWENGGGHFERKISFGYDADLVQVRAEFDGVMLRIVIPRRASPLFIINPPRLAPLGRV